MDTNRVDILSDLRCTSQYAYDLGKWRSPKSKVLGFVTLQTVRSMWWIIPDLNAGLTTAGQNTGKRLMQVKTGLTSGASRARDYSIILANNRINQLRHQVSYGGKSKLVSVEYCLCH